MASIAQARHNKQQAGHVAKKDWNNKITRSTVQQSGGNLDLYDDIKPSWGRVNSIIIVIYLIFREEFFMRAYKNKPLDSNWHVHIS